MNRTHALSLISLGVFLASGLGCSGDDPPPIVTKDAIEFSTASLPAGQQGQPYSADISAKGGSGEGYRWSVVGSLPAGLFMSSRGTMSDAGPMTTILGTPQVNGEFSFEVRLTDGDGDTATVPLSITLAAPPPDLTITTTELPDGGTETDYDVQLEASNGTQPYAWTLVGGALPPGITLSASGALTGRPADAGAFELTVRVSDADGKTASATLTLTVQDESLPLAMITTDLPDGVVDLAYSATLEAENGSPAYSWTIVGDAPPGLELEASGNPVTLAGSPTLAGSYTFQIEVEDAAGARVRRTFFVEIVRAPPPLRIITLSLPGGEVNSPYSATISGLNGSGSGYTWSISAGTLPPGLTLAAMGTPDTTLSGTPSAAGDFTFTVELRDDAGRVDESEFMVRVIPQIFPVEITTTSTSGVVTLPFVRVGESYDQTISAQNGFGTYHWVVSAGRLPTGLEVEVSGTPSTRIVGFAGERGTFDFTVTVYDDNNQTASQDFTLFVAGPEFPVNMVTNVVPNALACNPYSVEVVAQQGSNVDYQWEVSAGSLPPGLTLDPTGTPSTRLRGTIIGGVTGTFAFTVTVTDSAGDSDSQNFTISVNDDGSGDRWVVMVGDPFINDRYDIAISNVCQTTPSVVVQASPAGTTGDADTGTTDFSLSPDGTKVAFTGDFRVVGFDEVWITDISGPPPYTPVIVSPDTGSDTTSFDAFDLKWAPDGDHLVFMGDFSTNGYNELYAVDTSGALVANSAIPIAPALPSYADVDSQDYNFSPDGKYVAYAIDTQAAGVYDLWVYDLDSATPRSARKVNPTLPSTSADVNYPVVWIDDTRILYNCDCQTALRDELYLADVSQPTITNRVVSHAATSGNVRWTSSEAYPQYFGITEDGNWLYYFGDLGDTALGDTLYRVDTSDPTARGEAVFARPSSNALDVFYPKRAAGGRLVMSGDLLVSSRNDLFMFDLNQPVPQDVAAANIAGVIQPNGDVASYTDYEVSPDGRYVVFTADKDTEGHDAAYLADLVNPQPEPAQISPVEITDPNLDVFNIYWSPASNWVALYGDMRVNGVNEVWGVNVAAGAPYNWTQLGPQMGASEDVNSPIIWRADGGGVIFEADIGVVSEDQAWWVSVTDPGTAVGLTSVPTNGDIFYIKAQGQ